MKGLILIPTSLEHDIIEPQIGPAAAEHGWTIELCGFGPIAAASRSASLIEKSTPDRVLLLGIAGVFGDAIAVGTATDFDRVGCYGVGIGYGDQYHSAADLGFSHWSREGVSIGDYLSLDRASVDAADGRLLLTTPVASASKSEATHKLKKIPSAIAEDMEGFSVAVSCHIAGVPLTIIRGISNEVGDRDHDHWQIEDALRSAAKLAIDEISRGS